MGVEAPIAGWYQACTTREDLKLVDAPHFLIGGGGPGGSQALQRLRSEPENLHRHRSGFDAEGGGERVREHFVASAGVAGEYLPRSPGLRDLVEGKHLLTGRHVALNQ